MTRVIIYDDMTPEQKRIVDAGLGPTREVPPEALESDEAFREWLMRPSVERLVRLKAEYEADPSSAIELDPYDDEQLNRLLYGSSP